MMRAAKAAAPTPAPIPAFTAVESPVVASDVLEVAAGCEEPEAVDGEDVEADVKVVGDETLSSISIYICICK